MTVTLSGAENRTAVTNERGAFSFDNLPSGKYTLRATLQGFRELLREVSVPSNHTLHLALKMDVGALTETVTVTAESSLRAAAPPSLATAQIVGGAIPASPADLYGRLRPGFNTEAYDHIEENALRRVATDPLSTFSIDVDTASYANVRRFQTDGGLPVAGAVRIEELINYSASTIRYQDARQHFIRGGVNRVLLATDGDFNVGVTSQDELIRLIERERASGVFDVDTVGCGRAARGAGHAGAQPHQGWGAHARRQRAAQRLED